MSVNTKELDRAQLEAMGLSEEQIKAVLGSTEETGGNGLPYPLLKVNFDSDLGKLGIWGYNPIKNDDGQVESYEITYAPSVKIRMLKSLYQYSKFDSDTNKVTVASNIFKLSDSKKAVDLKTGTAISVLKDADDGIKFQRIVLGVIEDGEEAKPFIMYAKGSFLYEFNEIFKKIPNGGVLTHIVELSTKKHKKGTVTWFTPVLEDFSELSKEDFVKNIKSDADIIRAFDEWVEGVNNTQDTKATKPKPKTKEPEVDEDEDEIAF